MKDMQNEDEALQPYIDTCRLDQWYQEVLELAKGDFDEELREETVDGKNMQEAADMLDVMEREIKENEKQEAERQLFSKPRYKSKTKKLNGGFRSSVQQY